MNGDESTVHNPQLAVVVAVVWLALCWALSQVAFWVPAVVTFLALMGMILARQRRISRKRLRDRDKMVAADRLAAAQAAEDRAERLRDRTPPVVFVNPGWTAQPPPPVRRELPTEPLVVDAG